MTVDAWSVRLKAQGTLDALKGMSAKQKEQAPSFSFGQQFNQLLELAKEAAPAVDARLWPSPLGSGESSDYVPVTTNAKYVEIEAYIRQIINLLTD